MGLCVCDSKKEFSLCCEPLLKDNAKAKTVRQLVRSRYAAYALGGQANYLLQTWHPSTANNIKAAELNTSAYAWDSLEILRHQQKGDYGLVEFIARYKDDEGAEQAHRETSLFQRDNGDWFYLKGEVADQAE